MHQKAKYRQDFGASQNMLPISTAVQSHDCLEVPRHAYPRVQSFAASTGFW